MVALLAVLALLLGGPVRSDLTWQKRQQEKTLREVVADPMRFVDIGAVLHVVVADPTGQELIGGAPKLRILRTHRFGGMLDTRANPPRITGPSRAPVTWYCSEDQEPVILHADTEPLGQLVYGSEGAGKTMAACLWLYLRWLEVLGERREGGVTAPTTPRITTVRNELFKLWPSSWYTHRVAEDLLVMADGSRIRLVSTHQQSAADGSRIQGFNWSFCVRDEGQDQIAAHADIESRGRSARDGKYKQLITATAKDESSWRTLRDSLAASGLWLRRTMLGVRSPFVAPTFWEAKRKTMTAREFARRVEAQDVGPERMLYHTWDRAKNLRVIPSTALDVTSQVLRPWADNATVLVGHDPGKLWHVSLFLKAYAVRGEPGFSWYVVGEESTRQATIEQHVTNVVTRARNDWGVNLLNRHDRPVDGGATMLVRADPYSESSASDTSPDRGVYVTWRRAGAVIHPAAYVANATKLHVGRIPKEGGIDMVCRLFCSAGATRRLYVACDDARTPSALKLVESIESMERDEAGRAEMERKDVYDRSHWTAALRYGLWAIERPRMERAA